MEETSSDSEAKNNTMALSSSSALYYRQTAPSSVARCFQMPPESLGVVINIEPFSRVGIGVADSGFSTLDCSILSKLVKEKSVDELAIFGGVKGLGSSLKTDLKNGIKGDTEDISRRTRAFGANSFGKPSRRSFFYFVWKGFMDSTILVLMLIAALSFGCGIKKRGLKDGWNDGGSVFFVVLVYVAIVAICEFMQYRQFDKLSENRKNISVGVLRDSRKYQISIFEIVVGDIVRLRIGDQVPADGLFVEGCSLMVHESCVTRDGDCLEVNRDQNPFLLSGSKVTDGYATMLVTCVGTDTAWGEMMSSIIMTKESRQTPLQERLNKLTFWTRVIGLASGILILVVLLARYFTGNTTDENGNRGFDRRSIKIDTLDNDIAGIFACSVTIVVVAIPVGLSLAVVLTLANSVKTMMEDHLIIRNLSSCEAMGSATTICADLTTILLSNRANVTKSFIGREWMEGESYTCIAENVLQLLAQGISLTRDNAQELFTVTATEDAIYLWATNILDMEIDSNTQDLSLLDVKAASFPEEKSMRVLARRQSDNTIHVHWSGEFERILSLCSHYYDNKGDLMVLNDHERERFHQTIENMAASGLRWIALAHKHLSEEEYENGRADKSIPNENLVLLIVIGLEGFCHPGTKEAIKVCEEAGVKLKIITTEDLSTVKAIAVECGILSLLQDETDGYTITGENFSRCEENERLEKVEKIRVMARSSPFDKLSMVQCLKKKDHIVALTGHGTNYVSSIKEADIHLAMGIQGTQMEKENSDIIILDDNFASIVIVLRWGRYIYSNIQKFIQFQLTMNVSSLIIDSVTAVSTAKTPLTPAQMLWVNLIMGASGALAISAERPRKELMNMPPVCRMDALVTNIMWRNIFGQSLYQIVVILVLYFKGTSIVGLDKNATDTLIFTTFVFMQVFNQLNARELEKKSVTRGILRNKLLLGITLITIFLQVIMVEILNKLAHTKRLNCKQWGFSVGIGALSWPIGELVKFLPVPKRQMLSYPII